MVSLLLHSLLGASLLASLVFTNPLCQPNASCHLTSKDTLRCTNLNSSQTLFLKHCPNLQIKTLDLSGLNISRVLWTHHQTDDSPTEIRDNHLAIKEVLINSQLLMTIKHINLSGNDLRSFPSGIANDSLENYPNLESLDFSGNRLKSLEKLKLKNIRFLNASDNLIESIDDNAFEESTKLETLDLSGNFLRQIGKSVFIAAESSLKELNLSKNKLERIAPNAFNELHQLERLNLADNYDLRTLSHVVFPYHLRILKLNNISLEELNECPLQHLTDIKQLDLGGNPLKCNCHIYRIFQSFQSRVSIDYNSTCNNGTKGDILRIPIKELSSDCQHNNCHSRDTHGHVSELNLTISIVEASIKIKWRSTLDTHWFFLQVNDSSYRPVLEKYINYDREYQFEKSNSFMSYSVCISAVDKDHKEILQKVCKLVYLSDKNIIIGISAGVLALLPCVVLLIYIVCKDKKYTMKLLTEVPAEDKVPIAEGKNQSNGIESERHNKGFEDEGIEPEREAKASKKSQAENPTNSEKLKSQPPPPPPSQSPSPSSSSSTNL